MIFCIKFIIDLQAHTGEGVGLLYCHKHKKLYPRSLKVELSSINLYNTMLVV